MLGLHPHHFNEYSLRQLVNRLKGYQQSKENDKAVLRRLAYVITAPHVDKTFKPDDIYRIEDGRPKKKVKLSKVERIG